MGGCNSTWNDVELAGALVGAGVATVASGGIAAAGLVAATAASATYFATKQGCSRDPTAVINATNQIVATAIVQSLNYCTQIAETWQDINITCDPQLPSGEVYEGNAACKTCVEDVFQGMLEQHAMERKMWGRENPADVRVRLDINSEYTLLLGRVGTCGMVACKACTLANVSQGNILTANSACNDTLKNTDIFKTNLSALVQQQLLNNQDVLAGVAKKFASNNVTTLTETITNKISTNVTSTFLNDFVDSLQNTQIIRLDTPSFSGQGIAQNNVFQLAAQYVSSNGVAENSFDSDTWTIIQQVANEQNTLNDLGTLTFQATIGFAQAVDNVVGQVMIATLVVLAVVVLVIIGYASYKFIRKTSLEVAQVASEIELSRMQKATYQDF